MKPTSNFKMSKATKTSLALSQWKSDEQRHQWKRAMIQAELAASVKPKIQRDRKEG
jgi:hypothetical protein